MAIVGVLAPKGNDGKMIDDDHLKPRRASMLNVLEALVDGHTTTVLHEHAFDSIEGTLVLREEICDRRLNLAQAMLNVVAYRLKMAWFLLCTSF